MNWHLLTQTLRICWLTAVLVIAGATPAPAQSPAAGQIVTAYNWVWDAWASADWWAPGGTRLVSDVPAGGDFIAAAGGHQFCVALRANGSLAAWGNNGFDQVTSVPTETGFVAVCAMGGGALALRPDGSVVEWGYHILDPGQPPQPLRAIAGGASHYVGLQADGSLWSTGWFNGISIPMPPVPEGNDFIAISANIFHSAALRADGSIATWGLIWSSTGSEYVEPTPPEGNDFVAVSAGQSFGVALRSDGSLFAWDGDNYYGELNVPAGNDFVAVETYERLGAVALRADGSLVFWGVVAGESPPAGNDFVALGKGGSDHPMLLIKAVPVAIAGANQTVDCTSAHGATVTLNGSASYDPDNRDALQYEWSVAEDSGVVLAHADHPITTGTFPVGVHQVTLTVYDIDEFGLRKGGVGVASVMITVVDDDPPVALVTTSIASLWPANGAMIPVTVYVQASDTCTNPEDLAILCAVTSSQPDVTSGSSTRTGDVNGHDGYSAPVGITLQNVGYGLYSAQINLRAERDAAAMSGRIYSINLTVMDGAGNLGYATSTVVVPHDGKKK